MSPELPECLELAKRILTKVADPESITRLSLTVHYGKPHMYWDPGSANVNWMERVAI
jgi:hypothetical protein